MPNKFTPDKLTDRFKMVVPEKFKKEKKPEGELNKEPELSEKQVKPAELQPKVKKSKTKQVPATPVQAAPAPVAKSETAAEIEEVLSEGLADIYQTLDAKEREEFRKKGEETATKLEEMFKTFKVRAKEVLVLIKDWLMVIPKVNKYFLEQQSKIKTDQVLELAKKYKKEGHGLEQK